MELKVNKELVEKFNKKLETMRTICENHIKETKDPVMLLNAYNIFNDLTNKLQMNELVLNQKHLMEFLKQEVSNQVNIELAKKKGTN